MAPSPNALVMKTLSTQRPCFQPTAGSSPAWAKPQRACRPIEAAFAEIADHRDHQPEARRLAARDEFRQQPPGRYPGRRHPARHRSNSRPRSDRPAGRDRRWHRRSRAPAPPHRWRRYGDSRRPARRPGACAISAASGGSSSKLARPMPDPVAVDPGDGGDIGVGAVAQHDGCFGHGAMLRCGGAAVHRMTRPHRRAGPRLPAPQAAGPTPSRRRLPDPVRWHSPRHAELLVGLAVCAVGLATTMPLPLYGAAARRAAAMAPGRWPWPSPAMPRP